MHYVIYKTTNLKNGKWYIGKHKTCNLDDGYIGSGKLLHAALKKYGRENFTCEILHFLPSEEAMNAKEAELVTEEVVKSDDNYNLCPGGHGGWGYVNTNMPYETRGWSKAWLEHPDKLREVMRENGKLTGRKNLQAAHAAGKLRYDTFAGRTHTDETKALIGAKSSLSQAGSGNSQYGKCWIYSLSEKKSMRVDKEDLVKWIQDGWIQGRKMNFNMS